jgi:hypothetical protein
MEKPMSIKVITNTAVGLHVYAEYDKSIIKLFLAFNACNTEQIRNRFGTRSKRSAIAYVEIDGYMVKDSPKSVREAGQILASIAAKSAADAIEKMLATA